jgi:hypothetical protein
MLEGFEGVDYDKLYLYVQGLSPDDLGKYIGGWIFIGIAMGLGEVLDWRLSETPEAPTLEDLREIAAHSTTIDRLGF